MPLSPFADPDHPPTPAELSALLGATAPLWDRLVADVRARHAPIDAVPSFGGRSVGWTVRLRQGERIVLYLIPQAGHFLVGVVLGNKALAAARADGLAAPLLAAFDAAKPYAEGRGVRWPVATDDDVDALLQATAAKLGTSSR